MMVLFHFLHLFQMMKKKIVVVVAAVVAAVVAVVVEVLYDDFRRFQVRQHRLNLNYRMFVLDHPLKIK